MFDVYDPINKDTERTRHHIMVKEINKQHNPTCLVYDDGKDDDGTWSGIRSHTGFIANYYHDTNVIDDDTRLHDEKQEVRNSVV